MESIRSKWAVRLMSIQNLPKNITSAFLICNQEKSMPKLVPCQLDPTKVCVRKLRGSRNIPFGGLINEEMFGNQPLFLRRSPENCFPRPPTGRLQRVHSNCSPQTWQSLLWNAVRVRISPGRLSVRHCVAIFGPRRCDDRRNRISTISDRVKSGLASVPMLLTQ